MIPYTTPSQVESIVSKMMGAGPTPTPTPGGDSSIIVIDLTKENPDWEYGEIMGEESTPTPVEFDDDFGMYFINCIPVGSSAKHMAIKLDKDTADKVEKAASVRFIANANFSSLPAKLERTVANAITLDLSFEGMTVKTTMFRAIYTEEAMGFGKFNPMSSTDTTNVTGDIWLANYNPYDESVNG